MEHKLHHHHHPGDLLLLEELRLCLHETKYRTKESRVNWITITTERIYQPTIQLSMQVKGRETKRSQHMKHHLSLVHHQEDLWYPEQTSIQEIWAQVDPPYSVQPVESPHTGEECPYNNFCTTCNNHNHATHMCRAPKQTLQQSPAICVYCGSREHSSSQCHNRPWDNREQPHSTPEAIRNQEFQCANSEILGNNNRGTGYQVPNTQGQASQPHLQRSYSEIWETPVHIIQIIIQVHT